MKIRRLRVYSFTFLLLFVLVFCIPLQSEAVPKVFLNGSQLQFDVSPVIDDGRTLVPMRTIFEALGAEITWNQVTRTVTAVKGNTKITITVGSKIAYKNGEPFVLDVPAKIISGRTMVPLRFISESLGADVSWDGATQSVRINSKTAPVDVQLQEAKVIRAVDGDTIVVSLNGSGYTVRLIGIDTPESTIQHEPYGEEASQYTASMLTGKTVYLEKDVSETDKYGRLLRYVWLSQPSSLTDSEIRSKMFNAILVLQGYAQVATYPPDVKYTEKFLQYQREAVEQNKGLWGLTITVPPEPSLGYIGNANSKKFHRPDCRWAVEISPSNRVYFKTRDEAIKKGYSPCKVCIP